MEIKSLFSFDLNKNGEVVSTLKEYKVYEENGLFSVMDNNGGWSNLPLAMYNRIYGSDLNSIVENRRKWLIEIVLPDKLKSLNDVTNEIHNLSVFLNENK